MNPAAHPAGTVSFHAPINGGEAAEVWGLARTTLSSALRVPCDVKAPGQEVAASVRQLCDSAIAHGLHAEEVLVVLKAAWRELPEARRSVHHHQGSALASVVTLCIEEYYASARQR